MVSCNAAIADVLVLQNCSRNANSSISRDPEPQTLALSDLPALLLAPLTSAAFPSRNNLFDRGYKK